MSVKKRRKWSAEEKSAIVLDLLQGEETVSQVASRYSINPNMLATWRREFIENASMVFASESKEKEVARMLHDHEQEVKNLNRIIGQLVVERDYLQQNVQTIIKRRSPKGFDRS